MKGFDPRATFEHLRRVFWRSPWAAELGSALTAIAWSGTLWAASTDMNVWPSMAMLMRLAPEEAWQALAVALGLAQLTFLALDYRWMRWIMAGAAGWFWSTVALAVWVATPWAPHTAVYAGWAAVSVFSALRLLRAGG